MEPGQNRSTFGPVSFWALAGTLLIFGLSVFLLWWHRDSFPPQVPLWFSKVWGESRLTPPTFLWLLPGLIFLFLILNNLIAKFLEKSHPLLALMLAWTAFFIALVIFFPMYRIILSVT